MPGWKPDLPWTVYAWRQDMSQESGYARLRETRPTYPAAKERAMELIQSGWEGAEIREHLMNGVLILASSLTKPRAR